MSLTLVGASVSLAGTLLHRNVTVEMDDAASTAVVRGFRGVQWEQLDSFTGLVFQYRRPDGTTSFLLDGQELSIERKRGCRCR